jgi:hypothetical protein
MKKLFILLLALGSISAFGDDTYICKDVQNRNGYGETEMTIERSYFSGKVKSIDLVTTINGRSFSKTENPFLATFADNFRIDKHVVSETKKHKFIAITEGDTSIRLSQSLLDSDEVGYAHYYSRSCFILECNTYSYYFKCTKL